MAYVIFDIETRVDKQLLADALYPGADPEDAYRVHVDELREKGWSDFVGIPFHVPVSIAIAAVGGDHRLQRVQTLEGGEREIVAKFWDSTERFLARGGCLVSFNGRSFDLPVLELQALRHGIPARAYHGTKFGARYRFQTDSHLDLHDYLTGYGAARFRGGLNVLCRLIGAGGKGDVSGADVQGLCEAGRLDEIHAYCRDDIRRTYLLFLRVQVIRGILAGPDADRLAESVAGEWESGR